MVKHNNIIPNLHFHKKYCQSSRGPLKVKLGLDQASKKKSRRLARAKKAALIAPAPLKKLRPIVHCQTQKYSSKVRLGKGFSLEEVKAAGLTPEYARTVGIAVDFRRCNHSQEGFEANVERLKSYLANDLVIIKKGEAAPESAKVGGEISPVDYTKGGLETMEVTDEMKEFKAFTTMRLAKKETKVAGYRVAVENRKKKD